MSKQKLLAFMAVLFGWCLGDCARAQGPVTCRRYRCDDTYKCSWKVRPLSSTKPESLDKSERAGARAMAQFLGRSEISRRPIVLDGVAISSGPALVANSASTMPASASWEVMHTQFCPACQASEGRGRAEAAAAFKVRAEIHDPLNSDARVDLFASMKAEETTTRTLAELKRVGATIASAGSVTVGGGIGGTGGAGSVGLTESLGNLRKVDELFHDSDGPKEQEAVTFLVKMEAAVDRGVLAVDGNFFATAAALLELEPTAFLLTLTLSCDNCDHADSKRIELFPR
jgi:hypothetical protein